MSDCMTKGIWYINMNDIHAFPWLSLCSGLNAFLLQQIHSESIPTHQAFYATSTVKNFPLRCQRCGTVLPSPEESRRTRSCMLCCASFPRMFEWNSNSCTKTKRQSPRHLFLIYIQTGRSTVNMSIVWDISGVLLQSLSPVLKPVSNEGPSLGQKKTQGPMGWWSCQDMAMWVSMVVGLPTPVPGCNSVL